MSIELQKYQKMPTDSLAKLTTGALMRLRRLSYKQSSCECCGEAVDDNQRAFNAAQASLRERVMGLLKNRPHYANKAERKTARQAAAKRRG